ncbi:restriction endonuclease subunit S [Microcystis aeruginosa CS-1036]|uniref:restriction endonuclease subunit S n=1 Tax=Microcystis aeruginosa TaxID=1126 RepID=UPI00232C90BD|nr:restriction endonuclease subunit S [Microcystis aeruginosa]MDB9543296.1 restriction endonuclease subunit S [Microcystis aeruginosa CS-1036]
MTDSNSNYSDLPQGWKWVTLNDIAEWGSGGTPKSTNPAYYGGNIPWLIIGDLNDGIIKSSASTITDLGLKESSAKKVSIGAILIAMYGSIGKLGIAGIECTTNQAIAFTKKIDERIKTKYLFFYLLRMRPDLLKLGKGGTQANISQTVLKKVPIPLPPLPEQHRIVEKIEELFSELDNGVASLKKALEQLKTYRQAVLKWAFEGKLTEKWRNTHQDSLEDADTLLEQIKAERKRHYQQQLEDWKQALKEWENNGKETKKPTKPQQPKDLPPLTKEELSNLPSLPNGWMWVKLGYMTIGTEYGTSSKSQKEGKIPVLRMGNIQNGIIDWSDLVFTSNEDEIRQYLLQENDVLFNRTNSPELVGKTAIYSGKVPAIFAGYLIRINQINSIVNAKYLTYFLNSTIAKNHGNKVKTDGVNQSNINGEKLCNYPFPYISLQEQTQIVQEIESRLSVCDQLEATLTENLDKAEALRQSILKRAFEGKLVL